MSDVAIRVEGLGKEYRLGENVRYKTLRESWQNVFRRGNGSKARRETIWALKDVSFEIKQGEVVGVIGRNGAGKSTLLKVLSRITRPTTGRADIHGRVGSLLEVGTGFHPELTGRENIFLNGAIIGMTRREVQAKFDEIVAFAEIEKFLDTPVKRYSSGMYVRLAFAVAAHLEPEVLLIDEVLAVGDAGFQKRCLSKMNDIASAGRTILFVSHSMESIRRLCDQVMVLESGVIRAQGDAGQMIDEFLRVGHLSGKIPDRAPSPSTPMRLREIQITNQWNGEQTVFERGDSLMVDIRYDINVPVSGAHILVRVNAADGETIVSTGDCDVNTDIHFLRDVGHYRACFVLPTDMLNDGEYSLYASTGIPYGRRYDYVDQGIRFRIVPSSNEKPYNYVQARPGRVIMDIPWTVCPMKCV